MIKVFPTIEELNNFAAEKFVEIANNAIEKRGRFAVALSGGSTPKSLFKLLSGDKFKNKTDWSRTFFFFGDERNVLPDNDESNFKMAHENLFKPLQIKAENIFRWQTELKDTEEIAKDYSQKLVGFFELKANISPNADVPDLPQFDLILLGMGADGHTASLFPFTDALHETAKITTANPVEKLDTTRLTLTFSTINNAENIIFLIAGADKAEVLRTVLQGQYEPEKYPSQNIIPTNGELFWLLEKNAAKLLTDAN